MRPQVELRTGALALLLVATLACASGQKPRTPSASPPFDASAFRPIVVMNAQKTAQGGTVALVSGVVFSRAPLTSVKADHQVAELRPAELADLEKLPRVPEPAIGYPVRTFFEIRDLTLPRPGVHDFDIVAVDQQGRASNVHRVTFVRATMEDSPAVAGAPPSAPPAGEDAEDQTGGAASGGDPSRDATTKRH